MALSIVVLLTMTSFCADDYCQIGVQIMVHLLICKQVEYGIFDFQIKFKFSHLSSVTFSSETQMHMDAQRKGEGSNTPDHSCLNGAKRHSVKHI